MVQHLYGLLIGAATFLIIGIFHPIVIKSEYRWTRKCWVWFLVAGLVLSVVSVMLTNVILSIIAAVTAFSSFWGIHEVFEQENRVLKRWFPENPAHADYYASRRKEKGLK